MRKSNRFYGVFIVIISSILSINVGCGVPTAQKPSTSKPTSVSPAKEDNQITVAGNSGKVEEMIRDVVGPEFKSKYGIQVNYIAALSAEILSKVEIQKNDPKIDVVLYVPADVIRADDKGLNEKLDKSAIPAMDKVDDKYVVKADTSVPIFGYTLAPAYNTQAFEKNNWPAIQSWNDLARPEFKGKTAFTDIVNEFTFTLLYSLANANGGSLDNMDPGLQKAKEIARNTITFYKNSPQMLPILQQGGADVTVMGSYVLAGLTDAGLPFKMVIPKEGAPVQALSASIVKNTPHLKASEQLVSLLLTDEIQKKIADYAFNPVLKGMKLSPKYESVIGIKETDKTFRPDVEKIANIREEWVQKWSKEVNPELGKNLNK